MTLPPAAREALDAFTQAQGWERRARLLMQWGERLAPLDVDERCEANRVEGCESVVWLVVDRASDQVRFRVSSDARLLRGLLAVLLARVEGLSAEQWAQVDLPAWFAALGLERQLTPSRSNGLHAVAQAMRGTLGTSV